ncbi:unnamed protein product [Owenia fusiformis]|uniref:Uncharacterized protein n=1 Tax=Owenia fusiformis TaxID=6347 RepID=A0A8J1XNB5_OWEFU|nr:unnamed protein product [Owenia fusiformis]
MDNECASDTKDIIGEKCDTYEDRIRQEKKRQRLSSGDIKMASASKPLDLSDLMNEIRGVKSSIMKGQANMERKMDEMKTDLSKKIETRIKQVKDELFLEMSAMETKLSALEIKVNSNMAGQGVTGNQPARNTPSCIVIFRNAKLVTTNEDTMRGLLSSICTAIGCADTEFTGVTWIALPRGQNNGIIKATVATEAQVKALFKAKSKLKDTPQYASIYIERDRSRHERIMEANMRNLAKAVPNLTFTRGRLTVNAQPVTADPPVVQAPPNGTNVNTPPQPDPPPDNA